MESMVVKNLECALDDVSAMLLVKMTDPAETHLGRKEFDAMMTVPAYSKIPSVRPPRRRNIVGLVMMISLTSSQAAAVRMAWTSGQLRLDAATVVVDLLRSWAPLHSGLGHDVPAFMTARRKTAQAQAYALPRCQLDAWHNE